MNNDILLAGLVVAGAACQWFSWWTRIPAILYLLILGVVVGPLTGKLDAEQLLGDSFFPFISLSVAVVLFEGSLSLNFRELKHIGRVIRNLVTIGCVVTCVMCTLSAGLLTDVRWGIAAIFGAIMTVSGPAVIAPMLRTVRPTPRVGRILKWEGILIDPIGATLTVLVYEFLLSYYSGDENLQSVFIVFVKIVAVGLFSGGFVGYIYGLLLRRHLVPEFLQNVTTLGLVFLVFTGSNMVAHESGLLAVTVMGMVLGNMKNVDLRLMLHFKETLSLLLISSLFILLASRLELQGFIDLGWGGVALLLIVQFVIRPLVVIICSRGSDLEFGEKVLLSWIAPRGVVAAAVASLIAMRLESIGMKDAPMLVSLTFLVILGTVTFECLTASRIARRFKATEPDSRGVLIAGCNPVARAIAESLKKNDFRVLMGDDSRSDVAEARMAGLDVYYGNMVSEHAEHNLDMIGLGKMMAITPDSEVNNLICTHYAHEFGKRNVYCVSTDSKTAVGAKREVMHQYRGFTLFGRKTTYAKLASLMASGWKIRSTKLTEEFNLQNVLERHEGAITLFAITPKGNLQVFVEDGQMKPAAGWKIITLTPPSQSADDEKTEMVFL